MNMKIPLSSLISVVNDVFVVLQLHIHILVSVLERPFILLIRSHEPDLTNSMVRILMFYCLSIDRSIKQVNVDTSALYQEVMSL